ncbi:hypothetical protein [Desulfosporosinus nitroreducens]|uniref:AsmA family protein n=1 Tax=Desulfosporosinus nitroreducens TaxID=2018668 RepID=A0ABT8QUU8_9FIRM|nr:hypothetical protein [Desulfosporosinus nitroreducens]MDO0824627.1 AsmA family protein [Desulfosporosinus nitroreducens]
MRKVWIIISLAVLVVLLITFNGSFLPNHSTGNIVEEAIQKSGRNVTKVVHTEEVKGGVVVFYKKSVGNGGESNASGYVKKTLWGWEWGWGGEHSDSASMGFSAQYFPYSKGAPFPLVFGEIKDQQIQQIKVLEKDRTNDKEAKIVGKGTDLMWFVFLDKSEGPNFTITGLSSEGTTLYSETINTNGSSVTSTKPVP